MKEYPLIQLPGLDAIEAEKHEVLVNPDRVTYAIGGKTHAAGGTKMLAEPGSYILSDHLKLDPGVVKSLTDGKGKGKLSPAKIAKMYDTQKWSEILTSTDVRYDKLAKDTAALMFSKNAARQDMIYEAQEELKAKKGMKNDLENARSRKTNEQKIYQRGGWYNGWNPDDEESNTKVLKSNTPQPRLLDRPFYENDGSGVLSPWNNEMYDTLNQISSTDQSLGLGPIYQNPVSGEMPNPTVIGNQVGNQSANLTLLERPFYENDRSGVLSPWSNQNYDLNLGYPGTVPSHNRPLSFKGKLGDGSNALIYAPFANDPYFDIAPETLKGGKLTPEQTKILRRRQEVISDLEGNFPGQIGKVLARDQAKYHKAADEIRKDKYLEKYVVNSDGSEIPLADATEAQIDAAAKIRYFNTRTGKEDLVDLLDQENQGWYPEMTFTERPAMLDTRNLPIPPAGSVSMKPNLPDMKKVAPAAAPGEVKKGVDWQSIVNGTKIGLLAADLATTRTRVPYYDYAPSELAYTRFEPLSTRQQERAFNIAREGLENSNLPQQVKSAQLANMYAAMQDGVSQVDIANYQGKLANDNRNVSLYNETRNNDIFRQQDSNRRYTQEAERRTAQASAQRQVYLDKIMDTWNKHVSNRRDVGLVNQLSRNYDYQFNTEQVEYVPGQGNPPSNDRLNSFGQRQGLANIPSQYLTAEGRRALGYE